MWLSKHCSGHYVTTQACTVISRGCVHLRWCGSLEDCTLCITPGTSLVNEAPPMPLRASSHPGSPNSPSCSALAWYSCCPDYLPEASPGSEPGSLTRQRWHTTTTPLSQQLIRYPYAIPLKCSQIESDQYECMNAIRSFDKTILSVQSCV